MTVNTTPVFPKTPKVAGVEVTAANTKSDGQGTIGTDIFKIATVSASGAKLRAIYWWATGTVAATNTTATVGRAFVSTLSSGGTTAADTQPLGEVSLPLTSTDSSTTPVPPVVMAFSDTQLPASSTLLVSNHAAPAANTKWKAVAHYSDYE